MQIAEVAKEMKLEAYNSGRANRTLRRGLQLQLEQHGIGWKLTMSRPNAMPSKQEYKIISRAFFPNRVKHIRQSGDNGYELYTQH